MIVDRNISPYIIPCDVSIRSALEKINSNEEGMIICVSADGFLEGVLTDGDFRRWVMQVKVPDLERPIGEIVNRNVVAARLSDSPARISSLLSAQIKFLPLLDQASRCVAIVRPRKPQLVIHNRRISDGESCFIIAEIGNNHNGSIELARTLIDQAADAGADCVKFQMRSMKHLYFHTDNLAEDLGSQYTLDLLSRFQLSHEDLFRLFDYCDAKGLFPLCTPWDLASVELLERYGGLKAYKVASADLVNLDLLVTLARTGKPMICSTGMSTDREIRESVDLLSRAGAQFCLLHCNSTYPAPFKDVNLKYMAQLRDIGRCPVGYSSHDRGINVVIAAVALGANIVEKHFTMDRSLEGNDHRVSVLPSEFAEMVSGIRQIEEALGTGGSLRRLSQGELMNREVLGKSLFVNKAVSAGEIIADGMLIVGSPGRGLSPNRKEDIVGRPAKRDLAPFDMLFPSDLDGSSKSARTYTFSRPFGIPVRYHDIAAFSGKSNFDLFEIHLSYKDMEEDLHQYITHTFDLDLVVHAPELFKQDHVLDLASPDRAYRTRSVANLREVLRLTKKLRPFFARAERPKIIVNVGGFSENHTISSADRSARYELVVQSLSELELDGVEVLPQTMPPLPWHFGGQRYHNLFIEADEIVRFCSKYGYRVCLDTSHSKLACNYFQCSFGDFVEKVCPFTGHLHIADASGLDGEGLQIGEGEIDFTELGRQFRAFAPRASFIPEIWQGHKNGGEKFWLALERLEGEFSVSSQPRLLRAQMSIGQTP